MIKYSLFLLLISCNHKIDIALALPSTSSTFKNIDYSYDSRKKEAYSMHINNDGACIVGEGKIPANFFIGRLSSNDLIGIDSLISLIPDSSHGEVSVNADEVNRPSFHFLLTKIQGDYYSSLVSGTGNSNYLAEILKRLQNIKKGLKLNKVDTVYTFGSNILTPPPPPPISKKDEY